MINTFFFFFYTREEYKCLFKEKFHSPFNYTESTVQNESLDI